METPKSTRLKMYTYIEIIPRNDFLDVYYVVDESEEASGRKCHIGEIRRFMSGHWVLRPNDKSGMAWSLDQDALTELLETVQELNSGSGRPLEG